MDGNWQYVLLAVGLVCFCCMAGIAYMSHGKEPKHRTPIKKHLLGIVFVVCAFVFISSGAFVVGRNTMMPGGLVQQAGLKTVNRWYPFSDDPLMQKQ